jgi:transposase
VSMIGTIDEVEVMTSIQWRRRWSPDEKAAIVEETYALGSRCTWCSGRGSRPSELFRRRRPYAQSTGSVVGEEMVPASEDRAGRTKPGSCSGCSGK